MKPTLLLILALALTACASNNFNSNAAYTPAKTGTMITVDGIDIWQDEKPSHPYQIVRTIKDVRQDNLTPTDTIFHALAKQAHAAGGNGIIITSMGNHTTGGQVFDQGQYATSPTPKVTDSTHTTTTAQVIIYTNKSQDAPVEKMSQPLDVSPPAPTPMPTNGAL